MVAAVNTAKKDGDRYEGSKKNLLVKNEKILKMRVLMMKESGMEMKLRVCQKLQSTTLKLKVKGKVKMNTEPKIIGTCSLNQTTCLGHCGLLLMDTSFWNLSHQSTNL